MVLQKYKIQVILDVVSILYTFTFLHIIYIDRSIVITNILKSSNPFKST